MTEYLHGGVVVPAQILAQRFGFVVSNLASIASQQSVPKSV